MNKIEEIVNLYNLKEKRERITSNRREITHLKKEMSDLKIDRDVAIYAAALEKMSYGEEMLGYLALTISLSAKPNVKKYSQLRKQVIELEQQIAEYYRSVQIALRNRLMYSDAPDIYVYYGIYNKEVITKNIVSPELAKLSEDNTTIFPYEEITSKRKLRHFYNKKSFKYLEEVSKDNSLSLEGKDLGKVKVLRK